jgi:hypothetical protein
MYRMICEEVKKPESMYEAASTLLGSEKSFGQVHLLWQIFVNIDPGFRGSKYTIRTQTIRF